MLHQQKKAQKKTDPEVLSAVELESTADDGVPKISSSPKWKRFLLVIEIFAALCGWTLLPLFNDLIHDAVIDGGDKPFDVLFLIQDKKLFNEAVYFTCTVVVFIIEFVCVIFSGYEVWSRDNKLMKSVFFWSAATGFFVNIFTILPSPSVMQQEGYVVPFYFGVGSGSLSTSFRYGWTMYILHFAFNRAHHKAMKAISLWFAIIVTTYALLTHQLYCLTIITSLLMVFGYNYWCQTSHYKLLSEGVIAYVQKLHVEQKLPTKSEMRKYSIDDNDLQLLNEDSSEDDENPAVVRKSKNRFREVSMNDEDDETDVLPSIRETNKSIQEQLNHITEKRNDDNSDPVEVKEADGDEKMPMFNENESLSSTV